MMWLGFRNLFPCIVQRNNSHALPLESEITSSIASVILKSVLHCGWLWKSLDTRKTLNREVIVESRGDKEAHPRPACLTEDMINSSKRNY